MLQEHQSYLADETRLEAYRRALAAVVRPGAVVLDLGAGTGVLGMLACRAGAARVYVVDETKMLEIARANYRANGFAERAVFLRELSLRAELPEKVDVVVADQMGPFGVEARLVECFCDARERFLRPGGALVPNSLTLYTALIENAEAWQKVAFWDTAPAGFDFGPVRRQAVHTIHAAPLNPAQLLSDPATLVTYDFAHVGASSFTAERVFTAQRAGTLHGIAGWFAARLSEGATLTNSPLDPDCINRPQAFFPLENPVRLARGDSVRLKMRAIPAENLYTWLLEIRETDLRRGERIKATFQHSTFHTLLPGSGILRQTHPAFAPSLTPRGAARLTTLRLCDGQRLLSDIEQEVYRRHRDLFLTPDEAAKFVAAIVTRYAK
jgi:protein arginine N-methyltransferase 1